MIRLIQFGNKVAEFTITPSIIAQLPNWADMIERHRQYKAYVCDAFWPRLDEILVDESAMNVCIDNWRNLVENYIQNDYDLSCNKIIVVGHMSPALMESRRRFLSKYRDKPDVYVWLQELIWVHCPTHKRGNVEEFGGWIVV